MDDWWINEEEADDDEALQLLVLPPECHSQGKAVGETKKKPAKAARKEKKKRTTKVELHQKMREAAVERLERPDLNPRWVALPPDRTCWCCVTILGEPQTWSRPIFMSCIF